MVTCCLIRGFTKKLMRLKGVVQRIRKRIINNVGHYEKKSRRFKLIVTFKEILADLVEDRLRTMYLACLDVF